MNAFGFGTGRAMLVVAGLAATLTGSRAFAGNIYYPMTAATPYYYTTPSYGGAGPMMSGYRPVAPMYSGVTSCPGGVCPINKPTYTTRYPMTGVAGAGVPGNCPGGICYPTNCVNGQCAPSLGPKAVYPAQYKVVPKTVTPTAPVYYGSPKSAPAAVDTPIFYESGTPAAPRGPVTPAGGMVTDSPFYP
jgi:hypothetical protein